MRTLELKKKSLEELSKEYGLLTDIEQRGCIGGGDGSYANPWTWDEYNNSNSCYEGYVNICGLVTYILPAAVCTAYSYGSAGSVLYSVAGLGIEANREFFAEYNGTLRFTNSKGSLDIHFYDSGWQGGSKGKYFPSNPLGAGKIVTGAQVGRFLGTLGRYIGYGSLFVDGYNFCTASSDEERFEACVDFAVDCMSIIIPGGGALISLAWSAGLRGQVLPALNELMN